MTGRRTIALVAVVLTVTGVRIGIASPQATKPCVETKGSAAPAGAQGLVELQANASRPTFDIDLDDSTTADDQLAFGPKVGTDLAAASDVSADVVDRPRAGTKPLNAKIDISATLDRPKRHVLLDGCISGVPTLTAGKFEGTLAVYGPKVADLNYALVVTKKYPWWVAAGTLAATIIVFLVAALASKSLVFRTENTRTVLAPLLGVVFVIAFAAPVYWSSYVQNSTWGDNLGGHLAALAAAGFAAATTGLAAAQKLVGGEQNGDEENENVDGGY